MLSIVSSWVLIDCSKILVHNCWSLVGYQRGHDASEGFPHTNGMMLKNCVQYHPRAFRVCFTSCDLGTCRKSWPMWSKIQQCREVLEFMLCKIIFHNTFNSVSFLIFHIISQKLRNNIAPSPWVHGGVQTPFEHFFVMPDSNWSSYLFSSSLDPPCWKSAHNSSWIWKLRSNSSSWYKTTIRLLICFLALSILLVEKVHIILRRRQSIIYDVGMERHF